MISPKCKGCTAYSIYCEYNKIRAYKHGGKVC